MFRFTIRDVLWLMVVVGIGTAWLLDRDGIQRHRIAMAKQEAELISRAKMWENEAGRAEQRYADIRNRLNALEWEMRMRGTKVSDFIDAKNNPTPLPASMLKRGRP